MKRPKADIILINIGCVMLLMCIFYALFFAPAGWSLLEKISAGIMFFPCIVIGVITELIHYLSRKHSYMIEIIGGSLQTMAMLVTGAGAILFVMHTLLEVSQAMVVLIPNFVWVVILHTKTIRDSRNEEYHV